MPAPGSTDLERQAYRLDQLQTAELVIEGRMPWSSNATFRCELRPPGADPASEPIGRAIYKPHQG